MVSGVPPLFLFGLLSGSSSSSSSSGGGGGSIGIGDMGIILVVILPFLGRATTLQYIVELEIMCQCLCL